MLDAHTLAVKAKFVEAFNVVHRVLSRESFVDNIILFSKFSIYYANLLEEAGDFRSAVQVLRTSLQKVVEWREERMKSTVDTGDGPRTSMCISVDNKRIGELEARTAEVNSTWCELIRRKERDLSRRLGEA